MTNPVLRRVTPASGQRSPLKRGTFPAKLGYSVSILLLCPALPASSFAQLAANETNGFGNGLSECYGVVDDSLAVEIACTNSIWPAVPIFHRNGWARTPQQESLESRLGGVEIALRDENRHIITEAIFAGEAGRTLKDVSHELLGRE